MAKSLSQIDWVPELYSENLLAVYDVVLDVKKELQFDSDVVIPLFGPIVRFRELFPADSIDLRDRYCDLRWKAVNLLKQKGAVAEVDILEGLHRWDSRIAIKIDPETFTAVAEALKTEYQARRAAGKAEAPSIPVEVLPRLRRLLLRFHSVVVQLRQRREQRATIEVKDEYDVQDLLHAVLRIEFDDIRSEEWTPSYAGKSSRVDFLLKPERIVVEAKMTRAGHGAKQIGDELLIDIARYSQMASCETLACLVYDPENLIANPGGFQSDLTGKRDSLTVEVVIVPKQ